MHLLPQTKPTILFASLALAIAALSGQTQAAALSATASWTLNGAASGSDSATSTTYADILASAYDGDSNIFYHVGGNDSGNYSSRVSGSGMFDITGQWQSSMTFTNTLGSMANFNYGLVIEDGQLSVDAVGDGVADYTLILKLNGNQIASSAGVLSVTGGVASLNLSGFGLGGTFSSSQADYYWGSTTKNFELGNFADGESFTIDVDLVTHASRDLLQGDCTYDEYGGYGGNGDFNDVAAFAVGGEGGSVCYAGATARFGDPANPTGTGGTITGHIPEPATLALLGLGLAGVAGMRRNKRR